MTLHSSTIASARVVCVSFAMSLVLAGCDPHIVRNPGNVRENREFVSAPALGFPIYGCGSSITVKSFIPGAKIDVFIDDAPAPNPSFTGQIPDPGQTHDTGKTFAPGMAVYVIQTWKGAVSTRSNTVTVTSHTDDFPTGLPQPRLFAHPLFQCGHAVLVEDVVPNSSVTVRSEDPDGAGGFKPAVDVGSFEASTQWGVNWTNVNPQFTDGARVSAVAQLCSDRSVRSEYETTSPGPSPVPPGAIQQPVIDGQTIVTVLGDGTSPNDMPQHGAIVTVRDAAATERGKSAVPGGVPHNLGIAPPAVATQQLNVTQTLCAESLPGPSVTVGDCSAMPAPVIKAPLPGDTTVSVTSMLPGAEILVFASAEEVGHSSGPGVNLSRPLHDGETVIVEQRIGTCTGTFVYQIDVKCALGDAPGACSSDWPAFRQNGLRTGRQVQASPLGDPYAVKKLAVQARTTAPDGGIFVASPVIFGGRVFIGSNRGHLYAFDANFADGATPLWQYPPRDEPALLSRYADPPTPAELAAGNARCHNPSSEGVAASVAIATTREHGPVVIVEAPDQGRPSDPGGKFGSGLGSGRVFALDPSNGALVWKTNEEVARMTGTVAGSQTELHEQIGYSSPLVLGGRIYVGIADHCDNPIQNGKVKSINVENGVVDPGFTYESTSDRGGGVWTYVAGGLSDALVVTTGNVKHDNAPEPAINHGLSMVRLDPGSGAVNGTIQPVPYVNDSDPDWAAGATLMAASCGNLAVSTMKDGFTYAGNLGPVLTFRWQYPSVAYPFPVMDPLTHGDIRYHRAGAAWNDLYFTMSGGQQLLDPNSLRGYQHLHAFNVCTGNPQWVALLENYTMPVTNTHDWGLGPPTVTNGIVYVGTNQGFLLAIADPSVWPSQGARCTNPDFTNADCVKAGFQLVPNPTVLKALALGGQIVRGEPAMANGTLYVANSNGLLFRIAPGK
jgi:outer membrane protein assembly factor BamB